MNFQSMDLLKICDLSSAELIFFSVDWWLFQVCFLIHYNPFICVNTNLNLWNIICISAYCLRPDLWDCA
jgi:hypothetical protein